MREVYNRAMSMLSQLFGTAERLINVIDVTVEIGEHEMLALSKEQHILRQKRLALLLPSPSAD